jgi:hypothetical protein
MRAHWRKIVAAVTVIPGRALARTRNLEIPGSMRSLSSGRAFARTRWHRPGMTISDYDPILGR